MTVKILLDHDLEGYYLFVKAVLEETGWNGYLKVEFIRLFTAACVTVQNI